MYHTVSMIFYDTERCRECQKNDYEEEEEEIFTVAKCLYYLTLFSLLKNSEVGIYRMNCYINQIWSPLVIGFFSYILVYFRAQSWYFNKFTLAALRLSIAQDARGERAQIFVAASPLSDGCRVRAAPKQRIRNQSYIFVSFLQLPFYHLLELQNFNYEVV